MKYLIYGLQDPRTDEIHYIGKSSSGMVRPRSHSTPSHIVIDTNRRKRLWLSALRRSGMRPRIVVLEDFDGPELLDERETWWINYARRRGWNLYNILEGGIGGPLPTTTREKISNALVGHIVGEATRRAVAESNRRRIPYVRTPEMREASRVRQLGKTLDPEHLANVRKAVVLREARKRAMRQVVSSTKP